VHVCLICSFVHRSERYERDTLSSVCLQSVLLSYSYLYFILTLAPPSTAAPHFPILGKEADLLYESISLEYASAVTPIFLNLAKNLSLLG
jgi:hypothetical protein